jgi:two-component system sensor histidine kinase PilS (NtrC family)
MRQAVPGDAGRRAPPLAALVYVLAAGLLVGVVAYGSWSSIGRTFPGFCVLDNGTLAAFGTPDWAGWRAGLPLGTGVLEAVDGRPFESGSALLRDVAARAPGEIVSYRVRSPAGVATWRVPTVRFSGRDFAVGFGAYLFISSAFFALGALALALRPDQPAARSLAASLGALGCVFALAIDQLTAYRFAAPYQLAEGLTPAVLLHLLLVFPRERLSPRRRRLAVAAAGALALALALVELRLFYARPELARVWNTGAYLLMAPLGIGLVASLGEAFFRSREPEQRAKAAVVFAGGLLAFVVPAAALFAFFLLGWPISTTWWTPLLPVFPAFLLYAIVRHNLLEAERVVRLTVGYAIATSVVLLGYATALALLGRVLWPGAAESPAAAFALVLAVAVSFEPLRRRVQVGIDRAFFRSRIDVARALERSSGELATLADEGEIAAYVERELRGALSLEWAELRLGAAAADGAGVAEPVRFRGERLGLLACGPKQSGAPYAAAEIDFVRGLASQAALALHNARAIRDLREAQQALLRAERLAAVGEFAGAVAHGIRNPLAGIRAAAQLASQQAGGGPLEETLASVLAEADRLDQRIQSLLDFSRPYEPRRRASDMAGLLQAVRAALAPRAEQLGIEIAVRADARAASCLIDPDYVEEALLELAANALRAMRAGGRLCLRLDAPPGGGVVLRVSDSGGGIPPGVQDRIFDLFFTSRPGGTGIGLATVKKIVEANGGSIELESSSPAGTTFVLRFAGPPGAPDPAGPGQEPD